MAVGPGWQGAGLAAHSLSRKLSRAGIPSLRPLRLRVSATTWLGRLLLSKGSPGRICQWSKTHWGKAWPPVLERRSAVKPEKTGGERCEVRMMGQGTPEPSPGALTAPQPALTKRLVDRQVRLHHKHGGASHLGLLKDVASLPIEYPVDASDHLLWTLQRGRSCEQQDQAPD